MYTLHPARPSVQRVYPATLSGRLWGSDSNQSACRVKVRRGSSHLNGPGTTTLGHNLFCPRSKDWIEIGYQPGRCALLEEEKSVFSSSRCRPLPQSKGPLSNLKARDPSLTSRQKTKAGTLTNAGTLTKAGTRPGTYTDQGRTLTQDGQNPRSARTPPRTASLPLDYGQFTLRLRPL